MFCSSFSFENHLTLERQQHVFIFPTMHFQANPRGFLNNLFRLTLSVGENNNFQIDLNFTGQKGYKTFSV